MVFSLFFLAEYGYMLIMSTLAGLYFLGGAGSFANSVLQLITASLALSIKTLMFAFFYI